MSDNKKYIIKYKFIIVFYKYALGRVSAGNLSPLSFFFTRITFIISN